MINRSLRIRAITLSSRDVVEFAGYHDHFQGTALVRDDNQQWKTDANCEAMPCSFGEQQSCPNSFKL